MTVGVGFQCLDGVVLAADRQITKEGGLKYEEQKIFRGLYDNVECASTYAGDPGMAKTLFEDIFKSIRWTFGRPKREDVLITDVFKRTIEEILKKRQNDSVELLITFRAKTTGISPFLFRVQGLTVVKSERDYIGVGDSSVLRYIGELLMGSELSVKQAKIAGIYMVSLANRFIDGCKGTDILVMPASGEMKLLSREEIVTHKTTLEGIDKKLTRSLVALL